MVTLPTPQTYWRAAGAADNAWTLDADGTFTPAAGQAVEVVTVGPSPIARAVADTIPAISGLADLNATYASAITINAALAATGTNLVYSLTGPAWLSINPTTGQITGTAPSETVSGSATVTVRNAAGSASDTFAVVVSNGPSVALPQVSSLVGFGDSITLGYGIATDADKWLNRVSAEINSGTLVNSGISGTVLQNSPDSTGSPRSSNGRDRFISALTGASKREMAIIAYGFNDARYTGAPATFNLAAYENDLNEVIAGLRIAGYPADRLVIVAPYYITNTGLTTGSTGFTGQTRAGFEAFVAAAQRVAEAHGCWYFDAYAWMRDNGGASLISGDDIHPNVTGHDTIAKGMLSQSARLNTRAIPGSVTATGGPEQITVNWSAVSGASGYEVSLATDGSFAFGAPQAASGTSTTITGQTPGSLLRARVRAIVSGTPGPWGYADSAATIVATAPSHIAYDDVSAITVSTPLLGRVADSGQTWSNGNAGFFQIGSQGLYLVNVATSSNHRTALLSAPMASSAVYAQGIARCQSNNTNFAVQLVLWSTSAGNPSNTCYALDYHGSLVRIFRYSGGTQTVLSGSASYVAPVGGEFTLRLECEPGVQRAYLNGTLVLTTNDTAITNGGYYGIGGRAFSAVPGDTSGSHFKSVAFGVL